VKRKNVVANPKKNKIKINSHIKLLKVFTTRISKKHIKMIKKSSGS